MVGHAHACPSLWPYCRCTQCDGAYSGSKLWTRLDKNVREFDPVENQDHDIVRAEDASILEESYEPQTTRL
jgi:hypothetical protein